MSSKWSIFLNDKKYCYSERGSGMRPCDYGVPCDKCHYDKRLQDEFHEYEDTIDTTLYCSNCGHKLKTHEKGDTFCQVCHEYEEEFE